MQYNNKSRTAVIEVTVPKLFERNYKKCLHLKETLKLSFFSCYLPNNETDSSNLSDETTG